MLIGASVFEMKVKKKKKDLKLCTLFHVLSFLKTHPLSFHDLSQSSEIFKVHFSTTTYVYDFRVSYIKQLIKCTFCGANLCVNLTLQLNEKFSS